MFSVDINPEVVIRQRQALEAALSTNPNTERAFRRIVRKEILAARDAIASTIAGKLDNDPRGAAQAVRTVVFKKVLGANINIYNSRKRHAPSQYRPTRKLDQNPRQRGGNRRKRSDRTEQVMSYGALDRGFILRFVNSGTKSRGTIYGNRGSIGARSFFLTASEPQLTAAASRIANLIDTELDNILNKKKR